MSLHSTTLPIAQLMCKDNSGIEESEPKAYPKHQRDVLSLHSTALPIAKLKSKDTSGTDRISTQSLS